MIQTIAVKITDGTGLSDREKEILQATTMSFVAMTSALLVGNKGGGEGAALNPVEGYFCGITLIYQNAIDKELAETLKNSLELRFKYFFQASSLVMKVEIEMH